MRIATFLKAFLLSIVLSTVCASYIVKTNKVLKKTFDYLVVDFFVQVEHTNLMLGSSSVARLDDKYLECGDWLNRGIGNSTIVNQQRYLHLTPLAITPTNVLIYVGENDISQGMSVSLVFAQYKSFIAQIHNKYPNSELHVLAIKLSPARHQYWQNFILINNALNDYVQNISWAHYHPLPNMKINNNEMFADDGVHLTEQGYQYFTSGVNKTCKAN